MKKVFAEQTLSIDCRVCSIFKTVPVSPTKSQDSIVCSNSENVSTTNPNLRTESLGISEQQFNVR